MNKIPYTYDLLLPTLSPAAKIAVYEDGQFGFDTVFEGTAIKSRDIAELMKAEVRHIGVNERNKQKEGDRPTIEIFVDGVAAVDVLFNKGKDKPQ